MTKTADVKDVAANFSAWLKELAAGHEVVVTENGHPVARVVSPADATRESGHRQPAESASSEPKGPVLGGDLIKIGSGGRKGACHHR
jgi:prevent-host-death family protein